MRSPGRKPRRSPASTAGRVRTIRRTCFAVNASTGAVTVANQAALDFETTPSFNLTVTATDGGGLTDSTVRVVIDPISLLRPQRRITGMSAILLTHHDPVTVDWDSFEAHVIRTHAAGLVPAVNMDTGFVQILDDATRLEVLNRTTALIGGDFIAGAFVADVEGASFELDGYLRAIDEVASRGGTRANHCPPQGSGN